MLDATIRDNVLNLSLSKVEALRFEVTACIASKGQPIEENVKCELSNGNWKMTFRAGRHNSKEVAEKFIEYITDGNETSGACIGCDTMTSRPDELNFAFLGDLYFTEHEGDTFVGKDIVIAQGNISGLVNNWWIGGKNMENVFDLKVLKGIRQGFSKVKSSDETDANAFLGLSCYLRRE